MRSAVALLLLHGCALELWGYRFVSDAGVAIDGAAEFDAAELGGADAAIEQDAAFAEHEGGSAALDSSFHARDAELERDAAPDAAELEPCGEPAFDPNATYVAGDRVDVAGVTYRCREGASSNWCQLPWYEPGTGAYWQDAWDVVACPKKS